MAMDVLQDKKQIRDARSWLIASGVSALDAPWRTWMLRRGLLPGIPIGDRIKSWDVCRTVQIIEQHLKKDEPILDIGCFASEILLILNKSRYTNLTGVDLNPQVLQMPCADSIRYEVADMMHTPFEEASFMAMTAISVMEHGFQPHALLKEIARLLKPGGLFITSFDYWPEKIDTRGTLLFGMTWTIFSADEVADFVGQAASYGLFPLGPLHNTASNRVIHFGGKQYTFAWLALKKTASP